MPFSFHKFHNFKYNRFKDKALLPDFFATMYKKPNVSGLNFELTLMKK